MKRFYIRTNFTPKSYRMIGIIDDIITGYQEMGYDLSVRQLYYQLVTRNLIENSERSYKNIVNLVSNARLAGELDWGMIKDRGRECVRNPHWEDGKSFLSSVARQFRHDLWEGQRNYVEVMVEKQALEGVLEPVCRALDVPFTANKGYSSSSALFEAGERFTNAVQNDRIPYVIYLGDHDPSGIDMTRDVEERLDIFVKTNLCREDEIGPNEVPAVKVIRAALNIDQVRKFNPPENPAKLTDSRADEYVRRYGTKSWELDAIDVQTLADLVRKHVTDLMDADKFNDRVLEQDAIRTKLGRVTI